MFGPGNSHAPQSLYAGEAADSSQRGRDGRRAVTPTRLRTALQLGVLVITVAVVLFAVLSAIGIV